MPCYTRREKEEYMSKINTLHENLNQNLAICSCQLTESMTLFTTLQTSYHSDNMACKLS